METTVKERLLEFITHKGLSVYAFQKSVGMGNGYVNNIAKGIGQEYLLEIHSKYPELNIAWLVAGYGEMLEGDKTEKTSNTDENELLTNIINKQETIMQLKDKILEIKKMAMKAKMCPTPEGMQDILNQIIMD